MLKNAIAIVGASCLLPTAVNLDQLWEQCINNTVSMNKAKPEDWKADPQTLSFLATHNCGVIRGFSNLFDSIAQHYQHTDLNMELLDDGVKWLLYCAHHALLQAGIDKNSLKTATSGLVVANLMYPSYAHNTFAENLGLHSQTDPHWADYVRENTSAINRFDAALPGKLCQQLLGLSKPSVSIDAACASSLYAINLACEQLRSKQADIMLAAGLNAADPLFIQCGFSALQALSPSGQCLPFHKEANGLLASQGAACVVLKRLEDAVNENDSILGVIRSVGTANDGKSSGFLTPSTEGQVRAIHNAYQSCDLQPSDIDYIECHATGTVRGDGVELDSIQEVFFQQQAVKLSTLKGLIGHTITVSGLAALCKTLKAFEHKVMGPSLKIGESHEKIDEQHFQLIHQPIHHDSKLMRVGINAFGFGGCNAHMIVESFDDNAKPLYYFDKSRQSPVAIVGMGLIAGKCQNPNQFKHALINNKPMHGNIEPFSLSFEEAKLPPNDIPNTGTAQCLTLKTVAAALHSLSGKQPLPHNTAVMMGIQSDSEITRYSLLWRQQQKDIAALLKEHIPPLNATQAMGAMPNMLTNRINAYYDFTAGSFSVAGEHNTGDTMLSTAIARLSRHEIDAAIVGATEIMNDAVTAAAVKAHYPGYKNTSDGCVVLILERLEDAEINRRQCYKVFNTADSELSATTDLKQKVQDCLGFTHGCESLLQLMAKMVLSEADHPALPTLYLDHLHQHDRIAIIANSEQEFKEKKSQAQQAISTQTKHYYQSKQYIAYSTQPIKGKIASVFTTAHTGYPGMFTSLHRLFPQYHDALACYFPYQKNIIDAINKPQKMHPLIDELVMYSLMSQFHHILQQQFLRIDNDVYLGYCSGETNALFASQAWHDCAQMIEDIEQSTVYSHDLAGEFLSAPHHDWAVFRVLHDVRSVQEAAGRIPSCTVTIINTDNDCVIAGDPSACQSVLEACQPQTFFQLPYAMIIHCNEVSTVESSWYQLHYRHTEYASQKPHYSMAQAKAYIPDQNSAAQALSSQALMPVDFRKTVEQAWQDGIRIFIEHGPRDLCSGWINTILKDKEHLAVSFDHQQRNPAEQLAWMCAQLLVNNIPCHYPNIIDLRTSATLEAGGAVVTPYPHVIQLKLNTASQPEIKPATPQSVSLIKAYHQAQHQLLDDYYHAMQQLLALRKPIPMHKPSQPVAACWLNKDDLKTHASGIISSIFGDEFKQQDDYTLQVRMPEPPLLLADRVMSIEATPGHLSQGCVITETDVTDKAWYLQDEHIPPGIMVEAGQADLLLISYMGIDFHNKGLRAYRLLGCDLAYHHSLPKVGDTLRYEIYIDNHAQIGDVRLFFFHYDCYVNDRLYLTVRNGEAGFFNETELENSKGVIWDQQPSEAFDQCKHQSLKPLANHASFDEEKLKLFYQQCYFECFGSGYELLATHRAPIIIGNKSMQLLHKVTELDINGGPWQRGYCHAVYYFSPKDWFFDGHFKNDPCMPGTLMLDACFHLMGFYCMAIGLSLDKDGWRIEPINDYSFDLSCRGQATPKSKKIDYELFVESLTEHEGVPQLYASLMVSVDGHKAFLAKGLGAQLTRDHPIRHQHITSTSKKPFDAIAMMHFACGQPSKALGELYAPFDKGRRVARMPGPPYNFMDEVTLLDATPNAMQAGGKLCIRFTPPEKAWYFKEDPIGDMPFCILLEVALQPCGWLASFVGCPLHSEEVLCFRNLDGACQRYAKIIQPNQPIETTTHLEKLTHYNNVFIVHFNIECRQNNQLIFTAETSFGFFPRQAFVNQQGLPIKEYEKQLMEKPGLQQLSLQSIIDASAQAKKLLPIKKLKMIDTITDIQIDADAVYLRAEKTVDPNEWFFKAHFYQDPVQPGSLGLESFYQLILAYIAYTPDYADLNLTHFEPPTYKHSLAWKYRGQVTPVNKRSEVLVHINSIQTVEGGLQVEAEGSLWVDELKIYEVQHLTLIILK